MSILTSLSFAFIGAVIGGVVGPALSWTLRPVGAGVSLWEIREAAESGCRVGRKTRSREKRQGGQEGDILSILMAAFAVVLLYLKWRPWILVAISLTSVFVGVIACFVVLIARRRRIIAGGWSTVLCLLLPFLYAAVGIVIVTLLWWVPGAPPEVRRALTACSINNSEIGLRGIVYVLYSMAGGFMYFILAIGVILWDVALISAIYAAQEARPHFLWKTIACRMPLSLGWGMPTWGVLCAVVAIVLASGKGYVWLEALNESLTR